MKILILGGSGFLGTYLIDHLLYIGHEVTVFDRNEFPVRRLTSGGDVEQITGDFADIEMVSSRLHDFDAIYHLISATLPHTSNADPAFDVCSNLLSTIRLLELLRKTRRGKARRIIFLSSGGTVYGDVQDKEISESAPTDPICSYGITKLAIEKYLHLYERMHGIPYLVARLSNPYGLNSKLSKKQGVIPIFLERILQREAIELWGDGTVTRDYIFASDVAIALGNMLNYNGVHKIFNIGSSQGSSLIDIIKIIRDKTGIQPNIIYGEKREFDAKYNVLNTTVARRELGWAPTVNLIDGIGLLVDSYLEMHGFGIK